MRKKIKNLCDASHLQMLTVIIIIPSWPDSLLGEIELEDESCSVGQN